jgi:phage baseplate assembly protein W
MFSYNIKFPLRDDNSTNTFFLLNKTTKDALSSDLILLLLTNVGERYYQPDFGCNLLKFIFQPNDNQTAVEIEQEIKTAVSKYIPSLTIDKVNFNWNVDDEGNQISDNQLNINIIFTYGENAFQEQGSLDLNF